MWSKLKGMIMEDEVIAPVAPPAKPAAATTTTTTPAVQNIAPVGLNQAMFNAIRKATFSRNTALTALITASDVLTDIIPDPVMRLKAAQKTAGAGRSGKEISEAVAIHLSDVDSEEQRFNRALADKIQREIGGLVEQGKSLQSLIKNNSDEIQNLQGRIAQLQEQITTNNSRVAQIISEKDAKEQEFRSAETEFKIAAEAVRNELNSHKATILSTLD